MAREDLRPMVPVWIYSWLITNTLSFMHRVTGIVLALGLIALVCWLALMAGGDAAHARAATVFGSVWFKVPLTIWAYCFFFHISNGIRHLCWDFGYGFERDQIRASGRTVVAVAVVLTIIYLVFVII